MHARHRSPGNGYRASSMGMGVGVEASGRSQGFYNSEYRSFNRGFACGRGNSRPFQPPPQPPPRQGGDILVEAGRLAAEYLVSKGLLSPSVLSGKYQNGTLKKQGQDFQEIRGQEGDGVQNFPEGRGSAHSRLGNAVSDQGFGRRRYSDDYGSRVSRNHVRGGRRGGSFRGNSLDWDREYENGSTSESAKASPDKDGGDDMGSGHNGEQQVDKDDKYAEDKSVHDESVSKNEEAGCEVDKSKLSDNMGPNTTTSISPEKDVETARDGEHSKKNEDSNQLNESAEELKNGPVNEETKEKTTEDIKEGNCSRDCCTDLLALCKSVKVPTKTRSSLASRVSRVDPRPSTEVEHMVDVGPQVSVEDAIKDGPSDVLTNTSHDSKVHDLEVHKASSSQAPEEELGLTSNDDQTRWTSSQPSADPKILCVEPAIDAENTDAAYGIEQNKTTRSQSFPVSKASHLQASEDVEGLGSAFDIEQGKSFRSFSFPERELLPINEQVSSQDASEFGRSCMIVEERAEKRALEDSDRREGSKKIREWLPCDDAKNEGHHHLSNLSANKENLLDDGALSQENPSLDVAQKSLVNISQLPKATGESSVEYAQEKQFFPSSFKICDLNLMETSDTNEIHHDNSLPAVLYPSMSGNKNATQIDFDLSISNSNMSSQYCRQSINGKEIEVIDLEDDSALEVKPAANLEKKRETVFTGMEPYSNHAQSSGVITDVQDNYDGLMMSEFFNSFQNCETVPAEMNSLPGDMGVPDAEATLGNEESIYMSLDEIPLSFLRAWDQAPQPPQDYGKPF